MLVVDPIFCHWAPCFVLPGEVKTLMIQLLRGVKHLHDNWILHRDLKTSNLLLSHSGILKVRIYRVNFIAFFP